MRPLAPLGVAVTALAAAVLVTAGCGPTLPTYRYEAMTGTADALYIVGQTYYGDTPADRWMLRCVDDGEAVRCEEVAWEGRTPDRPAIERDLGMRSFEGAPQQTPGPRLEHTDPSELAVRCDDLDWASCTELGVRFEAGRGLERDLEMACELFDRACAGGYELACEHRHPRCSP
jgi:hypothetical protein